MIRSTLHRLLFVALLASACCAARGLDKANDDLMHLQQELRRGADGTLRVQLGKLASDALSKARNANGRLEEAVSWYRVAAVASAEAGAQGADTLFPSVDEGKAACDRLPQMDASLPRDCGLIRLALPVGVANDLSAELAEMDDRRNGGRLPATDLPDVIRVYNGFETQAGKVADIRSGMTAPVVPEALKKTADDQQRVIYCWALKSYSLAFDVEGSTPESLADLTARKTALRRRTEGTLGPIHCDELSAQLGLQ